MKRNIVLLGLIMIAISVYSMDFAPNEIIVKTRYRMSVEENSFGNDDIDEFLETKGNFEVESIGEINSRKLYLISFEEISVLSVVNEMKQFVEFEYIQPNYLRDYLIIPNDPELSEQYSYFTDINLFDAWNKTSGSENILISIIDSGIYLQHPDITKNIWVNQGEVNHIFIDEFDTNENGKFDLPEIFNYLQEQDLDYNEDGNFDQEDVLAESSPFIDNIDNDGNGYTDDIFGWDFTDAPTMGDVAVGDYLERDNNPTDESSHGTHVAGIVGATTNNGIGIAGICWDISLMAIRSGHRTTLGGQLQDDDIAASIIYSTNMGADVINASWGEYSESQIISDAIDYAFENDVIMVCSSGNTGGPGVLFPANLSNTIAVGSVGEFKTRSSFSSYGNEIDVMAPGSFVHSTIYNEENGYTYGAMSGTSMAAPHICGVIGLLLSQDPTLDFREVKYSIAESAEDINIEGFDIETGYGLINAGDLLNNENSSQIEISYPSDFSGESGTFEIIGTVKSELFSRYTVMYTDKENPTSADWSDVSSPHNNTPTFYFEQKENEKLAEFEISEIFTDGNYVVMVKMYLSDGTTYNDKIHISIDKTKPNLLFADYQKRYESSNSKHFFFTVFDDPVIASLLVEFNNEEHILSSSYVDSVHFFQLPISFSGAISITVNATNRAQLQMDEVSIDNIVIDDDFVSLSSYSATESGEAIIVTEKFIEETNSFFGYRDIAGSYAPIQRFQLSNNQISLVSTIQDTTGATIEGVPEDIGNTNSERIEFINLKSSVLNVYEAYELGNYDIFKSIFEIPECNGAVFGDYNGNNIDDIVACVDYDVNPTLTKKVLKLFSRSGSDFVLQYILYNNSETSFRNTFHPSTRIGDLDGDEFTDVLAVDQDGDAMIYELHTSANANEIQPDSLIWSKRLPVQNANLLEIGDFDGDGQNDFCVGGYYIDDYNYQNEYWCLSFYHTDGDNSFHLYDRLYFSNVQLLSRNNSINAADLNNDGTDELVCSFTPNAYIIDFDSENNEYTPLWAGLSGFSYRTLIKEASDETIAKIVMNTNQDNGSNVQIIQMSEEILLEPPHHFQAVPINQNEIELSWDFDEDADNYNIYRRNSDSEIVLFDTILDDSYIDDSVSINETYHYSISMIDNDFTPSESMQTNWISATPNIAPHLLNIKMNTANTIMLGYSFPLGNSAQEIGNYRLDNEYGVPTSAILISENKQVVLTYNRDFVDIQPEQYSLMIQNIAGITGVPVSDQTISFDFQEDVIPPDIEDLEVLSENEIKLIFDENITEASALDLSKYTIEVPAGFESNMISNLELINQNQLHITFENELVNSNLKYFIYIKGITDVSGNTNPKIESSFSLTEITDLKFVEIYPNPLRIKEMEGVRFMNLPLDKQGNIWIYNFSGELVFSDNFSPLNEQDFNYYEWKAVNNRFNKVSSGTYFYVLKMQDEIKKGTIVLIR